MPNNNPVSKKERMKIERTQMPEQDHAARAANFLEVNLGLQDVSAALNAQSLPASRSAPSVSRFASSSTW